jgi:hypothetical protein
MCCTIGLIFLLLVTLPSRINYHKTDYKSRNYLIGSNLSFKEYVRATYAPVYSSLVQFHFPSRAHGLWARHIAFPRSRTTSPIRRIFGLPAVIDMVVQVRSSAIGWYRLSVKLHMPPNLKKRRPRPDNWPLCHSPHHHILSTLIVYHTFSSNETDTIRLTGWHCPQVGCYLQNHLEILNQLGSTYSL